MPEIPSWEQVVERVVIASNSYSVSDAAAGYETTFNHIDDVRESLRQLKTNSESWKGAAADGFREHIEGLIDNLETLAGDHRKIKDGLRACAEHLSQAVGQIPIPIWMLNEVREKQQAYQFNSNVSGWPGGHFLETGMSWYTSQFMDLPIVGNLLEEFGGWVGGREATAQEAYAQLQGNYGGEYGNIPEGTQTTAPTISDMPDFTPTTPTTPTAPSTTPSLPDGSAPPTGTLDPSGLGDPPGSVDPPGGVTPPGSTRPDLPGTGSVPSPAGAGTGGFDPDSLPGTGLAGAGTGGLSGAGGGLGGGLSGAGGGLGAGAGAGGLGGKLPPLGPVATPPPPNALMGAGAGAGRGGAGRGGAGRGAAAGRGAGRGLAAMGGGHGAGADGDGDEHSTWLKEDEDVWGGDDAPPSGVLGV